MLVHFQSNIESYYIEALQKVIYTDDNDSRSSVCSIAYSIVMKLQLVNYLLQNPHSMHLNF